MLEEADQAESPSVAEKSDRRAGMDVLTRRLLIASALAAIAVLGVTVAIVFFAAQGTDVPRTQVERDAMVSRQKVRVKPNDPEAWVALAATSIRAERYDDAAAAISSLERLTKRAPVAMLKGDLALAKGDVSGARGYYEAAADQAKKDYDADVAKANESGVRPDTVHKSVNLAAARIALGRLDLKAGQPRSAIKNFKAALEIDPRASDVLTMLGEAQAADGQKDAAARSFEEALKYIPDYQPAIDGLKKLKGGS